MTRSLWIRLVLPLAILAIISFLLSRIFTQEGICQSFNRVFWYLSYGLLCGMDTKMAR